MKVRSFRAAGVVSLFIFVAFAGNLQAQTVATLPFAESFEGFSLPPYWTITGTGAYDSQVSSYYPHGGFYHLAMDSLGNGTYARNEFTLAVDLAGYTNVVLSFWAVSFNDEPDGPPPSPFIGGADFDGVAISQDGVFWYEVQGLRNIALSYTKFTVNLDAAVAAHGLAYNSNFYIRFNQYDNFAIPTDGIGIDDISITGNLPGALDHFVFSSVPSPQTIYTPFPTTITAVDLFGSTVSNFTSTVALSGLVTNSAPSATILGNLVHDVGSFGGPLTVGYAFTPNTNITVTHVRNYSGIKISIWTDDGTLVASQNVSGLEGSWQETPLSTPAVLLANTRYRVATYTTNGYYYRNTAGPYTFSNGTIDVACSAIGDAFPSQLWSGGNWDFVDLRYVPGVTVVQVQPAISANFVNGTWSGNLTITQTVASVRLHADDGANHSGDGNNFSVLTTNDLVLTATPSANPVALGSNLVYTLNVFNTGPSPATSVVLSNSLPTNATYIATSVSQGTYSAFGTSVVCNLGTLAGRSNAVVNITVSPTSVGFVTNSASVSKAEFEPDTSNNSVKLGTRVVGLAILSVTPGFGLSSTGYVGGPFNPTNQIYTVSNSGTAALSFSTAKTAAWLTISPPGSSLTPGASMAVSVSLNSSANSLASGNYSDTVTFTNVTTGFGSTTRAVNILVRSNSPPVATPQTVNLNEDTPTAIALQGTDPEGDTLTATITSLPFNGKLYQTPDGVLIGVPITAVPTLLTSNTRTVIYVPATNAFGNGFDSFLFRVNDPKTNSPSAAVTINVNPVNDPPVAVPDLISIPPGVTSKSVDVLANDYDPEGDPITLTGFTQPLVGSVTWLGAGNFTYTQNPNVREGVDEFTYTISDGQGGTSTGKVSIYFGALVAGDWPTFGNGPQHTGYYPSSIGSNVFIPAWTNSFALNINQVAVGSGLVFVTTPPFSGYTGDLFILAAYNAQNGRLVWQTNFNNGYSMNPPTYADGKVYFQRCNNGSDTQIRCVDALTGTVLWTTYHGAQWENYFAPTVVGDGVWVNGGTYGGMYGFNTSNGSQRFFDSFAQWDAWTPTYYSNVVYAWVAGTFAAANPVSGSILWSTNLPSNLPIYTMNTISAIDKDRAYLMAGSFLYSIDLASHSIAWSVSNSFKGSPALANGIVYSLSGNQVNAYNVSDGSLLGSYVATNDAGISGQPIVTDDALLVSSSSRTYIFDLNSHQYTQQPLTVGGALSVANGMLYAANGNALFAFTLDSLPATNDLTLNLSAPVRGALLQPLSYTMTVSNTGPTAATGVSITNTLPLNVSYVSAVSSQGTCVNNNGIVGCNLGTLAGGGAAIVTITVIPTTLGILVDSAQVSKPIPDTNLLNNRAQVGTFINMPISINNVVVKEGDIGTTNAIFTVTIPTNSSQTIVVNYATSNGTASATSDYVAQTGTLTFPSGVTNQTITITVKGDTLLESDETFFVNLYNPSNAVVLTNPGQCTILNDDGFAGQVDHFAWNPVPVAQYPNQPFPITVTAQDAFYHTVSNFSGGIALTAVFSGTNFNFENGTLGPWTPLNVGSPPGPYELVQFDVNGDGYTSTAFRVAPDSGGPDGISQNLPLKAGVNYVVDADLAIDNESGGINAGVDWGRVTINGTQVATTNFGTIGIGVVQRAHVHGTYTAPTDGLYNLSISFGRSYAQVAIYGLIDDVRITMPASATNYFPLSITLTNGIWSGLMTFVQPCQSVYLQSDDGIGHSGASNPFAVLTNNAPIANAQTVVTPEDTAKSITLTGSDPESDPLTYSVVIPPTNGVLSGSAPNLLYSPNTNYFGLDNFTFRVNDGKGNAADGQVTIIVSQVTDVGFARLSFQGMTNGQSLLSLLGEPYERYRIEASQDLVHWTVVTNLLPTNGPLHFIDPDAPLYPRRYYRGVLQLTFPQINSPHFITGGSFAFSFPGDIGRNYQVLASTNLINWVVLTNMTAIGPTSVFTDPAAPFNPRRFYMARPSP